MPVDRENGSPPYIANPATGNKHSQTRALRIIARNQGYDPDAIYASDGSSRVVGSMQPWDRDPTTLSHSVAREIPGGVVNNWQDGGDIATSLGFDQAPPFSHPDPEKENKVRHTSGADPFPGMPGAK